MKPCCQTRPRPSRDGSVLIESSLVVALMSLVLFGVLQVSRLYAAREILDYSAMNAARARAVGFNSFMVYKVMRVSAIPNAGVLRNPEAALIADGSLNQPGLLPGDQWDAALAWTPGGSPRAIIEQQRIPFYLGADNQAQLWAVLDYEHWNTINHSTALVGDDQVRVHVSQQFPVRMPMWRTFMSDPDPLLQAGSGRGAQMADHSALYLQ